MNMATLMMYLVVFAVIIYFMMIRPQRKQQQAKKELFESMAEGDSVLTKSGFYGVIIGIMDQTVIVEFGNNRNCRIPMQKDAIAAVEKPNFEKSQEDNNQQQIPGQPGASC